MKYVVLLLFIVMISGCAPRQPHQAPLASVSVSHEWRLPQFTSAANGEAGKIVRLLTTSEAGVYLRPETMLWIEDRNFVQFLYTDLQNAAPQRIRPINFALPRPLIFFNEADEVAAAFSYFPGANPEYSFRPGKVIVRENTVLLETIWLENPGDRNGIVLSDFKARVGHLFELLPK